MSLVWTDLANSPATLGWTVNNLARKVGVPYTKAALFNAWTTFLTAHDTPVEGLPPISAIDTGANYLVSVGLATYDGTTITFTHLDADGRPAHLRRVPGNEYALELNPNGVKPTDGT
jgi:hypothetical protein